MYYVLHTPGLRLGVRQMQTAGGRTDDYDLRTVRGRVGGSVARYRVDTRAARRAWSRGGGGGLARSQSPSVTTGRAKRARGTEHRTSSEAVADARGERLGLKIYVGTTDDRQECLEQRHPRVAPAPRKHAHKVLSLDSFSTPPDPALPVACTLRATSPPGAPPVYSRAAHIV